MAFVSFLPAIAASCAANARRFAEKKEKAKKKEKEDLEYNKKSVEIYEKMREEQLNKLIEFAGDENVRCPHCGEYYTDHDYIGRHTSNVKGFIGYCSRCKFTSEIIDGFAPQTYRYIVIIEKFKGIQFEIEVIASDENEARRLVLGYNLYERRGYEIIDIKK